MRKYKTYISFVIQEGERHVHDFVIADLNLPIFNFYLDNTSQQVVKWAEEKQKELKASEKIVIVNYFNVSNIK
ncbi:MAG: hypothetical protein BGO54_21950 [Sphingobacteriales bacterium 46-32]|nr:MAG: hypothetical protein BGO54_21950 [Sphingobacteriales bacterium 46-32]